MADPTRPMNGQQIDLSTLEAYFNTPEGQELRAELLGREDRAIQEIEGTISRMSAAAQDLFFGRLNATYNGGAKDPVQGRAYFNIEKSLVETGDIFKTLESDSKQLGNIMTLFNNHVSSNMIIAAYYKLSGSAKIEIQQHLQAIAPPSYPSNCNTGATSLCRPDAPQHTELKRRTNRCPRGRAFLFTKSYNTVGFPRCFFKALLQRNNFNL